eukprot:TRINITY_DN2950_c0_g1_i1.p1 TRINITY_DN2950_c0_g1~~TRINITY_DN2950_c0_g1_i1.p1  ORF type:complete len:1138 (+),score=280.33 TRINITY_DN2950_c0_g1_i1:64-3477(+)
MDGGFYGPAEVEDKQHWSRIRVPAHALIALGSAVSTAVSLSGGYVLYAQGLEQLQDAVEAVSKADALVGASTIRRSFDEVYTHADAYAALLTRWNPRTLKELQAYLAADQFARTASSVNIWCTGFGYVPMVNSVGNATALLQYVWWDALSQPDAVRRNNGSVQQWVEGHYLPAYHGHPSCAPASGGEYLEESKYCIYTSVLDARTGRPLRNVYNYSDGHVQLMSAEGKWGREHVDWSTRGASFWRALNTWTSEDGTTLAYTAYYRVLPHMPHVPMYRDVKLYVVTYLTTYTWPSALSVLDTEAFLVVTALCNGLNSLVLGLNRNRSLVMSGCSYEDAAFDSSQSCVSTLRGMPPAVQDAARILNATPPDTFQRHDVSGGEHWMRRRVIYERVPERDALPTLWLLWINSIGSIQAEADASLITFIMFIAGVLVFDILILVTEVRKIGAPLRQAAGVIPLMHRMQLEQAETAFGGMGGGCCAVAEIAELGAAFSGAVHSLQDYLEFLPHGCLPYNDDPRAELAAVTDVTPPEAAEVCVAFTDIQGSTALWEWAPLVMHKALLVHNAVIRRLAAEREGYEVKVIGDAFLFAFREAADGLRFALSVQQELLVASWPPGLLGHDLCRRQLSPDGGTLWCGLRVRIGMNYGPVFPEENPITRRWDCFGPTVNVASRIESAVRHGGLVGVSASLLSASGSLSSHGNPVTVPMGSLALRGVAESVPVFIVLPAALRARQKLCVPAADARAENPLVEVVPAAQGAGGSPRSRLPTKTSGHTLQSGWGSLGETVRLSRSSEGSSLSGPGRAASPCPESRSRSHSPHSENSPSSSSRLQQQRQQQLQPRMALRLQAVSCSAVCVRCALPPGSEGATTLRLPQLLLLAEHHAGLTRGSVLCVCSSTILLTWNWPKPSADHNVQAFHFIAALSTQPLDLSKHLGAASGPTLAGNMAGGWRRHSVVVGGCVEFAVLLAAEAELGMCHALMAGAVGGYACGIGAATRVQIWRAAGSPRELTVMGFVQCGSGEGGEGKDGVGDVGNSRWAAVLPQPHSTGLDEAVPAALFERAARGEEGAADRLREALAPHSGDARAAATLAWLAAGRLRVRTAPGSAFFEVKQEQAEVAVSPSPEPQPTLLNTSLNSPPPCG